MERDGWNTTEKTQKKKTQCQPYYQMLTAHTAPRMQRAGKQVYRSGLLEVARDHYPEFLTKPGERNTGLPAPKRQARRPER